jgi:uncharacterized membrane protein YgdD (TMEM256/DUF423 family)
MSRLFLSSAAFLGGLSVVLGAYASHGIKPYIAPEMYSSFQTGLHYQVIHSIVLLAVGILYRMSPSILLKISGFFLFTGIILFSFSIYLHAGFHLPVVYFTPFGGLSLILGWFFLFLSALRLKN